MSESGLIEHGLIIDGQEVMSSTGEMVDIFNPTDGEVFGRSALATEEDIDAAVAAAKNAFDAGTWSESPIRDRSSTLHAFADLIDSHLEDLFRLETKNNGRQRGLITSHAPVPGLSSLLWDAAGIVTATGSPAAHLFESARALGIPGVCGVDLPSARDRIVAMDGDSGLVATLTLFEEGEARSKLG